MAIIKAQDQKKRLRKVFNQRSGIRDLDNFSTAVEIKLGGEKIRYEEGKLITSVELRKICSGFPQVSSWHHRFLYCEIVANKIA